MKKLLMVMAVPVALLAGLSALPVTGGCGLLDSSSGIWINLPDQEFEFSFNASQAKQELQNWLNQQGIPVNIMQETTIPPEAGTIQETFDVETPPQQVDLSNEEDLKSYIEAGKVKSVEIKYVQVHVAQNTLNFNMPEISLYMGDLQVQSSADASLVAVSGTIEAGWTGAQDVQFTTDGRQIMSNLLLTYKFAVLGKFGITIDTDVTRTLPSGQMTGKIVVATRFKVDPL